MLLLIACVTADSAAEKFLADGVYEPSCAPYDGPALEFTFGQSGCSANIDGTRARFLLYHDAGVLYEGYTVEVGDEMQASIGEDPGAMKNAVSGSLRVDAIEEAKLTVTWALTTDEGVAYAGDGVVEFCDAEVICG